MLFQSIKTRFAAAAVASSFGAALAGTPGVFEGNALADAPSLSLTVNAGSTSKYQPLNPNSVSGGAGIYNGTVFGANDAWGVYYNLNAASNVTTEGSAQTGVTSWMNGSLSLTNMTDAEVDYIVSLTMPTSVVDAMWGRFNGSVSGTLVTTGAGFIQTIDSSPLWTASTAGAPVATLFNAPVNVSRASNGATSLGSQSFGTPVGIVVPTYGSTVDLIFHFRLSAGDTGSFTTGINGVGFAVPAPGALALLATAGVVARRRRR